jgi:HEAT repeat protein
MKNLDAKEIIRLLEAPVDNRIPIKRQVYRDASIKEIIIALKESTLELTRMILCDILGERRAKTAIPDLLSCLDDQSPRVRSAAADALSKIGDARAGELLMNYVIKEADIEVRRMYMVALGAVGYRYAIPVLIKALSDIDSSIRGSAAWSLGALRAIEATNELEQALNQEEEPYPKERMKEALGKINGMRLQAPI